MKMTTGVRFVVLLSKTRKNELFLFNSHFYFDLSLPRVFKSKLKYINILSSVKNIKKSLNLYN